MNDKENEQAQAIVAARTLGWALKKGIVVTVKRAADMMNVTPQAINRMLIDKRITDLSIGRAHFVLASEIEEYRQARETIKKLGGGQYDRD